MSALINKLFDLRGKTALVTGGSSGLGEEIALALGMAGAELAIAARREGPLKEACARMESQGIKVSPYIANLSDLEEAQNPQLGKDHQHCFFTELSCIRK